MPNRVNFNEDCFLGKGLSVRELHKKFHIILPMKEVL